MCVYTYIYIYIYIYVYIKYTLYATGLLSYYSPYRRGPYYCATLCYAVT